MLPSETMIWQPEFTDKTLSRKPGAVQGATLIMSYAFDHIKGVTTARFTTLYGCSVLVPEYTGIVIAGQ